MVNIPKIIEIEIEELRVDGKNPNKMSDSKFVALKKNMAKYGFLVPIITNKDLVVADGEHRLKAGKSLGMDTVPVVRLEVNEVDRRILRQVMNKLRGEHSEELDRDEYKFLDENEQLHDLAELLGENEADFYPDEPNEIKEELILDVFGG